MNETWQHLLASAGGACCGGTAGAVILAVFAAILMQQIKKWRNRKNIPAPGIFTEGEQ